MTHLRHFLSIADFSREEILSLLERAGEIKAQPDRTGRTLAGRCVGMLFEKPSTRTRVSFEVAVAQLGGHPVVLKVDELQLGRGEPLEDTARVLSRYLDCLAVRTTQHSRLEQLAQASTIPIINLLSDAQHPCQALADLFTVRERLGKLAGLKLAYLGDGNNVCSSLVLAAAATGMHVKVATPAGYGPSAQTVELARQMAQPAGGSLELHVEAEVAAQGADILYTDVWTSMGQEADVEKRRSVFSSYQLNSDRLASASKHAIVMHCLPAHRGEEITNEVIDGGASAVWDQAENRLHTQKALLEWILGGAAPAGKLA